MDRKEVFKLIKRFNRGQCSPDEIAQLESWYLRQQPLHQQELSFEELSEDLSTVEQMLNDTITIPRRKRILTWLPYAAAALVALLVGYFMLERGNWNGEKPLLAVTDIHPGGNRATLTIAGGQTLDLNAEQSGIVVGADIRYSDGSDLLAGEAIFSTEVPIDLMLTTPRGGQYQVTLPDGSRVWLNSESTLTYPSRFDRNERLVKLSGEGYFEVIKDTSRPFKVQSNGQTVEVLGTSFNISAYPEDHETKTTLVEGEVRVASAADRRDPVNIHPGEQATVREKGTVVVNQVDIQPHIAWKSGIFNFSNETLASALRKVSRWYDVTIEYTDPAVKNLTLEAILPRYTHIKELLTVFEKTGTVRFDIKGKNIVVKSTTK